VRSGNPSRAVADAANIAFKVKTHRAITAMSQGRWETKPRSSNIPMEMKKKLVKTSRKGKILPSA
jgi:hypothetical protein